VRPGAPAWRDRLRLAGHGRSIGDPGCPLESAGADRRLGYCDQVDEDRQERLAKNESLFRDLNENISDLASTLGGTAPFEFICECSTSGCYERLSLTLAEYERVRQDGTHFLLADGHEDIEIEQVVSDHGTFVVVEKDGVAGLVADDDDPRG
jgi:hypothetical protein